MTPLAPSRKAAAAEASPVVLDVAHVRSTTEPGSAGEDSLTAAFSGEGSLSVGAAGLVLNHLTTSLADVGPPVGERAGSSHLTSLPVGPVLASWADHPYAANLSDPDARMPTHAQWRDAVRLEVRRRFGVSHAESDAAYGDPEARAHWVAYLAARAELGHRFKAKLLNTLTVEEYRAVSSRAITDGVLPAGYVHSPTLAAVAAGRTT